MYGPQAHSDLASLLLHGRSFPPPHPERILELWDDEESAAHQGQPGSHRCIGVDALPPFRHRGQIQQRRGAGCRQPPLSPRGPNSTGRPRRRDRAPCRRYGMAMAMRPGTGDTGT